MAHARGRFARSVRRLSVAEPLERRRLLANPLPSASYLATAAEGSATPFVLASNGSTVLEWRIDFGDGSPLLTLPGSVTSGSHVYLDGPAVHTPSIQASLSPTTTIDVTPRPWLADPAFTSQSQSTSFYDIAVAPNGTIYTMGGGLWEIARRNADGTGMVSLARPEGNSSAQATAIAVLSDNRVVGVGNKYVAASGSQPARYEPYVAIYSASGTLTTTRQLTGFVDFYNEIWDATVVQTPAGEKILLAGNLNVVAGSFADQALVRLNLDLSSDTTFSEDGVATIPSPSSTHRAFSVAVQPDGKMLLGGDTGSGNQSSQATVTRFNVDGSIDTSFGTGGTAKIPLPNGYAASMELAIQTDGRILVGARSGSSSAVTYGLSLLRLTSDGQLDPSFTRSDSIRPDFAATIAIAVDGSDGFFVLRDDGFNSSSLRRFFSDGTPDPNFFGSSGVSLQAGSAIGDLVRMPDGRLLASGNRVLQRFVSRPTPINVADVAPRVILTLPTVIQEGVPFDANFQVIDPGDDPLTGYTIHWGDGSATTGTGPLGTLSHTYTDGPAAFSIGATITNGDGSWSFLSGAPDSSFGKNAVAKTEMAGTYDDAKAAVEQPDGKFLVVGSGQNRLAVARFLADGSLDTTFGIGGRVTFNGSNGLPGINPGGGLALLPDGDILVGGYESVSGTSDMFLARLNPDGSPDASWGIGGFLRINVINQDGVDNIRVDATGRIIVTGIGFDPAVPNRYVGVVRLLADGTPDPSFGGGDGKVIVDIGLANGASWLDRVHLYADGRILLAGGYGDLGLVGGDRGAMLVRLLEDGTQDPGFGVAGGIANPPSTGTIGGIAVLPDGTIYAGQNFGAGTSAKLSRFRADGTLDTTFGTSGLAAFPSSVADGTPQRIAWMGVDAFGRIVATGDSVGSRYYGIRLTAAALADSSFGGDGVSYVAPGATTVIASTGMVTASGAILTLGYSGTPNVNWDWTVARFGEGVGVAVVQDAPGDLTFTVPSLGPINRSIGVSFAKVDVPGDRIASWSIDWGDGSTTGATAASSASVATGHTYATGGTFTLTLRVTDDDGVELVRTALIVIDADVPEAVSSRFEFETVRRFVIDFDEPVSYSGSSAPTLNVLPTSVSGKSYGSAFTFAASQDGMRWTWTYNGTQVLPDSRYRATLQQSSPRDAAGNTLAAPVVIDFHILPGDANQDRAVNFDDLLIVAQNYGATDRTFSQGNFDYSEDGLVGFDDLLLLAQRYGTSLAIAEPINDKTVAASRRNGTVAAIVLS